MSEVTRGSLLDPSYAAGSGNRVDTDRARLHRCHEKRIAEAREALGAILTAEQVHFQRTGGSYVAASDTAALRTVLGVEVEAFDNRRWVFRVADASSVGFVASATGRPRTEVAGVRVILDFERQRQPSWSITIEGCRPKPASGGEL